MYGTIYFSLATVASFSHYVHTGTVLEYGGARKGRTSQQVIFSTSYRLITYPVCKFLSFLSTRRAVLQSVHRVVRLAKNKSHSQRHFHGVTSTIPSVVFGNLEDIVSTYAEPISSIQRSYSISDVDTFREYVAI